MPFEELIRDDDLEPTPTSTRRARAESGWVFVFVDGVVVLCTALYWLAWGHFFDRAYYAAVTGAFDWQSIVALSPTIGRVTASAVRVAGVCGAFLGVFVIVVAATAFRRHERWAWYVVWTLPALAALDFALLAGHGAVSPISAAWDIVVFAFAVIGLAVPYRSFFGELRRSSEAAA